MEERFPRTAQYDKENMMGPNPLWLPTNALDDRTRSALEQQLNTYHERQDIPRHHRMFVAKEE